PKTRDLVKHYAAQLLDAGAEVSVATIRARILDEHGVTASPNVVSDEVRQFWARTGPLLSARLRRPGIPEAVCLVLDSVWEVALNEATGAFAIERAHAVQQADQANARAAVAQEEAEQARGSFADHERQIGLLTEQVERLTRKLDKAEATSAELRDELQELTVQHHQQQRRQAEELNRLQTGHQEEQARFAATHAAELSRLQVVHQEENTALRAEVSRQADIFEGTSNHLMMETSRVRDAAKQETERLSRELAYSRDLVDQLRVQRSQAKEESAGLRAQAESAVAQLHQLQKNHERLEARYEKLRDELHKHRDNHSVEGRNR
ncbi:MAG: DNA-binding protein, partial [Oxalobacteraceae bacterium]